MAYPCSVGVPHFDVCKQASQENPSSDPGLPRRLVPLPSLRVTCCGEVWGSPEEGDKPKQSKPTGPCDHLNWHQGKVASAGTGACVPRALLVCHGNPGWNRDRCHSGSEREAACMGRLFWHCVQHALQSITVKCLITDVVIEPEELCLYFLVFIAGNNKVPH